MKVNTMSDALLEVSHLKTHFFTDAGVVQSVNDISFSVAAGEILGLVGESGSGKSITGFSIIGLLDKPGKIVGGSIKFKGRELIGLPEAQLRKLRGSRIAMVFQDPMMTLNPVLTIETQMIETVLAHQQVSRDDARKRALHCLKNVGIAAPAERLQSYPHQLSGGLRQRVAIAIALLNKPDLIIADEPTTALDVTIQAQILFEVQNLCRQQNTAIIWITHDLSVVAGLASKICVMYAGRDVEQGSTNDVLDHPHHPYTVGLLESIPSNTPRGEKLQQIPGTTPSSFSLPSGCAFRNRCERAKDACKMEPPIITLSEDATYRCFFPKEQWLPRVVQIEWAPEKDSVAVASSARETKEPLLTVANVFKRFPVGKRPLFPFLGKAPDVLKAVSNVSFNIYAGEVVGLVGESGCGKSTLGRMIAGINRPSEGQIRYKNRLLSVERNTIKSAEDLEIQLIFQNPFASLNPRLRVKDIIGIAPSVHGIVPKQNLREYVDHIMQRCGLDPAWRDRFPHQFSGGQRQRIGIARALAVKPKFLVCDEAISALDVSIQAQIINLLIDLRQEFNLTYLFISHDLGVIKHICDRVIVMYLGKVVEEGTAQEVFNTPMHPYTKALINEVPKIDQRAINFTPIRGEIPSPIRPPSGCYFHPRCPKATSICSDVIPVLQTDQKGHRYACHHPI